SVTPPGTSCAMGRRFGNPAGVSSVTFTSASDDAARQPSSAAVRQFSGAPCSTGPAVLGVAGSEAVTGAFSAIAAFPVVVPAAFTVANSGLPPSPAGWVPGVLASGVVLVGSSGVAGGRRRVRTQTDSSSVKIGSSTVWSPTGAGGGCGGTYGLGAG